MSYNRSNLIRTYFTFALALFKEIIFGKDSTAIYILYLVVSVVAYIYS